MYIYHKMRGSWVIFSKFHHQTQSLGLLLHNDISFCFLQAELCFLFTKSFPIQFPYFAHFESFPHLVIVIPYCFQSFPSSKTVSIQNFRKLNLKAYFSFIFLEVVFFVFAFFFLEVLSQEKKKVK